MIPPLKPHQLASGNRKVTVNKYDSFSPDSLRSLIRPESPELALISLFFVQAFWATIHDRKNEGIRVRLVAWLATQGNLIK
ncbi:MAG: hypothetical protein LBJ67_11010 [Planctomycetaceae bacterium]|jgi:hypothetical protein|nr:hypothetical protein [Planctomycetaceae bacterium]